MREIWTKFIGAVALALAWLPFGPAFAQDVGAIAEPRVETPAARPPRPAIWLLADDDTKIYLFGTVHILPPDLDWRSPALERTIAEADELVLEVSDEEMANAGAAAMEATMLGKSVPVAWRVSPDRRDTLAEMISVSGIPGATLDGLQTWAVAMSLSVAEIMQAQGTEGEQPSGVEDVLTEAFRARGRPISGVETTAGQLAVFSGLPHATQRAMLEQMIDAYATGEGSGFDPGETQWLEGDLDGMAAEMEEMPPELYEALLTRRNAVWTDWLIGRLDRPGTVLFAVGAGHLAGRVSVQSMLAARGFTVTRID